MSTYDGTGHKITTCTKCERRAASRGLCHMHYLQGRRSGELQRVQGEPKPECCAECDEKIHAQGLCAAHYIAARRAGTITVEARTKFQRDDWKVDTSGKRCRCGLRLPCNDCLPTNLAEHMSPMDRESASGL